MRTVHTVQGLPKYSKTQTSVKTRLWQQISMRTAYVFTSTPSFAASNGFTCARV